MNQQIATRDAGAIAESVIAKGDLAKLTPAERTSYYQAVCESVGLNPLTQPLAYITLNGKLTLYALRGATDQLRKVHGVSVVEMTERERDGAYIVTVKVQDKSGRTDIATGAVPIGNMKGDALANQIMKAETKAKRRATLSIVGLGMLDETEVETIPDAKPAPRVRDGSDGNPKSSRQAKLAGDWEITKEIATFTTDAELDAWQEQHAETIATFNTTWREQYDELIDATRDTLPRATTRKTLLASLHKCKDATAIQEWQDAHRDIFRTMTKPDQQEVVRERDARLAELFVEPEEVADADGVLEKVPF